MATGPRLLDTAAAPPAERPAFWSDCIARLFQGLKCEVDGGATGFDGRMSTVHAGDVVLTRLEADRHHVVRPAPLARHGPGSEPPCLKIVAPYAGCAGVRQQGRETWVTPDQWSLYDTSDSYAVANPTRVEHLIVVIPKHRLAGRGLALEPLLARRLGGTGGIARLALETMRSAWRELPGMGDNAAAGVGDAITQFVHLAMLDLAGATTGTTQREALRERIKQHVGAHLGDGGLTVDGIAQALGCSRRQLYNAFAEEPDGVAGYILRRRLQACRDAFDARANDGRSITDIALAFGFSNMAHFSRAFRSRLGMAPSDYRRHRGAADGGPRLVAGT